MLVVSMSDFLSDSKQYMEKAQHTSVLVEKEGEKPVKISVRVPNVFKRIADVFKPKPRPIGTLAKKGSIEFIGDWEVTPEEFLDNDEDFMLSDIEKRKQG